MTKVSESYAKLDVTKTPEFRFPVKVAVEYKWNQQKFRVIFTSMDGQAFPTNWLWNGKWYNGRNQKIIDAKLQQVGDSLNQKAKRNIRASLMESRRDELRTQRIEAKINR